MDYRPLNNGSPLSSLIVIRFSRIAIITICLPLTAFIYCILWSLMFNFTASTSTHCGTSNYLPSVSAAIGTYNPQRHVWRTAIGLHSTPRYLIAFMYLRLKHNSLSIFILNIIEISTLIGLTFVSSTENYPFHEKCFITFMISAIIGMFSVISMPNMSTPTKKYLAITNMSAGVFAVYFFVRHNWYCESGVYTLFALSEYIVVFTNMLFHFQAYFDFQSIYFSISNHHINAIIYP